MPITPNLQEALLGYISGINVDVSNSARAQAARTGAIQGTPEYANAFRYAVINHAIAFGESEGRPGAEQLVTVVTNERNAGFDPVTGISITPPPPSNDGNAGGGDDSGGDVVVPPGGDVVVPPGGGIMSEPVDLAPVTNLIGTPGAGQTGTQATLMGQTAGLATGQQGIRDVVDPLAGQVTTLQETVDPLASDLGTVKTDVGGIKTDVGTVKTGVGDVQSAIGTPAEGQTLFGGQQGIMSGIGTAGTGQTDLFKGQADLTTGQTGIQSAI